MARITMSVIKADIGAVAGHTLPSAELLATVEEHVASHRGSLLIDHRVTHTGDDVAIIATHTRGAGNPDVHAMAWDGFLKGTAVARRQGLYGAGQDLLKDAFSGNVRGLGPGVAEVEFTERPNEPVIVFAADKTEPGAFNLPFYLAFADPMFCSGLLVSTELHDGFSFRIMDVDYLEGDRTIVLEAPERLYDIACLLRDPHRYVIESIWSRKYPTEQAVAVSTTRLRNIAGKYVGKDDPVAIVRVQKMFPATEEFGPPFAIGAYVAGDTRGSHNMPLMPVPINTPASTYFCVPMVSAMGFSVSQGILTGPVDLFGDPFWAQVRHRISEKAIEMRRQGFFEPAMLPIKELEYGGITVRLGRLDAEFVIGDGRPGAAREIAAGDPD